MVFNGNVYRDLDLNRINNGPVIVVMLLIKSIPTNYGTPEIFQFQF